MNKEEEEDDDWSCPICGVIGCDGDCYPKPTGYEDEEDDEDE